MLGSTCLPGFLGPVALRELLHRIAEALSSPTCLPSILWGSRIAVPSRAGLSTAAGSFAPVSPGFSYSSHISRVAFSPLLRHRAELVLRGYALLSTPLTAVPGLGRLPPDVLIASATSDHAVFKVVSCFHPSDIQFLTRFKLALLCRGPPC